MALVVESTSTASGTDQDTLSITAPTGISEGDLLLIIGTSPGTSTGYVTSSGFSTSYQYGTTNGTINFLYKIATVADESTGSYTVDLSGSNSLGIAVMLRVSGWATGNPYYANSNATTSADAASVSLNPTGLSLSRPAGQLLILAGLCRSNSSPLTTATVAGYSVTSSDSNPTWTEVVDTSVEISSSAERMSMAVAYAVTTATSTITAWNMTFTADVNGGDDFYLGTLGIFVEPVNGSGSNALLSVSPTVFDEASVSVGTTGTTNLHNPDTTLLSQSGDATAPTQWTNEAVENTTWTNEDSL